MQATNANVGDAFGTSVAIDGDYIVVGTQKMGLFGTTESAYLFHKDSNQPE